MSESKIDEHGNIIMKRTEPFMNNYNKWIMYCILSNMDINMIPTAKAAKACAFYSTDYSTKDNLKTYNIISVAANVKQKEESATKSHIIPFLKRAKKIIE